LRRRPPKASRCKAAGAFFVLKSRANVREKSSDVAVVALKSHAQPAQPYRYAQVPHGGCPVRRPKRLAPFRGDFLAAIRTDKGMKQADLAEQIGITASGLSRLERRHNNPKPSILEKLCQIFGRDKEFWYSEDVSFQRNITPSNFLQIFSGYTNIFPESKPTRCAIFVFGDSKDQTLMVSRSEIYKGISVTLGANFLMNLKCIDKFSILYASMSMAFSSEKRHGFALLQADSHLTNLELGYFSVIPSKVEHLFQSEASNQLIMECVTRIINRTSRLDEPMRDILYDEYTLMTSLIPEDDYDPNAFGGKYFQIENRTGTDDDLLYGLSIRFVIADSL
jgi:transcriptional regulator with XRE-family HTH domain